MRCAEREEMSSPTPTERDKTYSDLDVVERERSLAAGAGCEIGQKKVSSAGLLTLKLERAYSAKPRGASCRASCPSRSAHHGRCAG